MRSCSWGAKAREHAFVCVWVSCCANLPGERFARHAWRRKGGDSLSSESSENDRERELACVVSQANGEDPAGTGTPFAGYLLVEVAPPWEYDVGESRRFPEGLWEAVKGLWEAGVVEK